MSEKNKSYTDKFKEQQEKLKNRADELFSEIDPEEEPQSIGNPKKIFDEDENKESQR